MQYNIVLDDKARVVLDPVIYQMNKVCPDIMVRKNARANVQQAFVLQTVMQLSNPDTKSLCIGSYEDTAFETLKRSGVNVRGIDPVEGTHIEDLDKNEKFDIVFATSVLEHVVEDFDFIRTLTEFVAPGGYLIFTCDFKREYQVGDPNCPTTSFRFYTPFRFSIINNDILFPAGFQLVDEPNWDEGDQDFEWEGHKYAFATIVAQKK